MQRRCALRNSGTTFARAQRIEHHGAAAGTELDQAHVLRRAHQPPGRGRPQADQLAEHLADLGRGDEVAVGAERIAGDVVAVLRMGEAQRHVLRDRHRAGGRDAAADFRSSGAMSSTASCLRHRFAAPRRHDQDDAGEHQRQRQQHAHGEPAPEKAELRIGLAEKFAERCARAP